MEELKWTGYGQLEKRRAIVLMVRTGWEQIRLRMLSMGENDGNAFTEYAYTLLSIPAIFPILSIPEVEFAPNLFRTMSTIQHRCASVAHPFSSFRGSSCEYPPSYSDKLGLCISIGSFDIIGLQI